MAQILLLLLFSIQLLPTDGASPKEEVLRIVEAARGVYRDESKTPPYLANSIIVVAANSAYFPIYKNWAMHARVLGLKWIVIAMDHGIYDMIGEKYAIMADVNIPGESTFRQPNFNMISCEKKNAVRKIIEYTNVDVIFSDVDNVWVKDPLAPERSLGRLIQSGFYDYIFQMNLPPSAHPEGDPNYCRDDGQCKQPSEANTGFYFLSNKKNSAWIALLKKVEEVCIQKPEVDDQTNFWKGVIQHIQNTDDENSVQYSGSGNFLRKMYCEGRAIANPGVFHMCNMNPYEHPTGKLDYARDWSTYHANWCVGSAEKIERLKVAKAWRVD
eukprot:m.337528 g.337528  ORF g.337528 m.337528 type:complete len:327 (+) comp18157_c0_seq1:144-1124(+)